MDKATVFGTVHLGSTPSRHTTATNYLNRLHNVRVAVIETASLPWQGSVLPLNHTRIIKYYTFNT